MNVLLNVYLQQQTVSGHRRRIDQHEEAEYMLETYLAQV